jgi:2-dehydro-3-deoxyglucarate aldolase/4-hydroxy-2-oxoheptanedioate aldolase
MRSNHVKHKVHSGGRSIGTFMFEFSTTSVGRLAAEAGAEFAIFDMEHTGWSVETIRMLIATNSSEMIPLVRIPATEYHFIARVLDMGAMGIMVPMCESAAQAQLLVASAKYPPVGRRGAAFTIAHDDYTGGDIVEKIRTANTETLLIAQIETAGGVGNVDEIAAVEGIDVLWIGHFDLSNSLGIPGQFDHPHFQDAVARVLRACEKHGKVPGFLASDIAVGKKLLDQGFRMLAYGGDLWLYQEAVREGVAALQNHGGKPVTSRDAPNTRGGAD